MSYVLVARTLAAQRRIKAIAKANNLEHGLPTMFKHSVGLSRWPRGIVGTYLPTDNWAEAIIFFKRNATKGMRLYDASRTDHMMFVPVIGK